MTISKPGKPDCCISAKEDDEIFDDSVFVDNDDKVSNEKETFVPKESHIMSAKTANGNLANGDIVKNGNIPTVSSKIADGIEYKVFLLVPN